MASSIAGIGGVAVVLAALALSGCARPVGDFGRAEDDPLHDAITQTGIALQDLHQPLSRFNLSDEEVEMRDRIWRYLVAPEAYDWFGDSVVELSREGFQVKQLRPPAKDRYYLWIHGQAFASSSVRFSRLADDVKADIGTMPATFAAICAVEKVDSQRDVAAKGLTDIEPAMKAGVVTRRGENQTMIGWFATAVTARYDAYSYALDHLLVETPHVNAVGADATLNQLAALAGKASQGDFCDDGAGTGGARAAPAIRSRYADAPAHVVGGS